MGCRLPLESFQCLGSFLLMPSASTLCVPNGTHQFYFILLSFFFFSFFNFDRGNIKGNRVYTTGTACRRCPRGHHCTDQGLCSYGDVPNSIDFGTSSKKKNTFIDDPDSTTLSSLRLGGDADYYEDVTCTQDCVSRKLAFLCDKDTVTEDSCEASDNVCCTLAVGVESTTPVTVIAWLSLNYSVES
jgi:hypothetical protein